MNSNRQLSQLKRHDSSQTPAGQYIRGHIRQPATPTPTTKRERDMGIRCSGKYIPIVDSTVQYIYEHTKSIPYQ